MRLAVYGATSVILGAGVIISAFNQRANFYSACVHLAQSNACLMVLTNLLLLLSILFGHALQLIFYGPLRTPEIENLYEKAWYAVTETCLAMTIFRDEFDVRFIVMFGVLLFIKCFCWIGGSRVEFMETSPPDNPTLFHIRLASSLILLLSACSAMLWHSVSSVLERGRPNMMVMFAFEFAILLITSLGITGRYVLSLVEKYILKREAMRRRAARILEREGARQRHAARVAEVTRRRRDGDLVEDVPELEEEDEDEEELDVGGWEEKGTWVFYLELVTDLLKLLTYLSFFSIVLRYYGLPLHIIRDVYLTLRSFITRIRDFIRYRRATAHMNSRYPDATPEEVEREGAVEQPALKTRDQDQKSFHVGMPVLDEPLNGPGVQNAAARAQANAAGGAGLAFGAQLGPLGFDIGVGGPGFVQNLMDRMNQQQRPQPQQNQQNQQNQQQQNQQHNQQAQLQAQLQAQIQAQIQAHAQNQGLADVGAGGAGYTDLDQQMLRIRLLEREVAVLEMRQQLQAQAAGIPGVGTLQGQQVPATPLAPGATPAAAANPYLNTGNNLETNLPPRIRTPGMSVYHGGPVLNGSSATAVLPQGMVLPPGWNVVPLTAPGSTPTALPITTPGGTMSLRGAESLRSRRGQQMYRERMMDHHARLTPGEEQTSRSSRPAFTRSTTAPSGLSLPQQNWAAQRTSGPVTGGNLSERLSQEQMERLSPTVQRSVATISRLLQWQLESGNGITVHETLAGLPDETREEILQGWPNRDMAQELAEGARNATHSEPGADMVRSVANIARWLEILPREERIQVVLGFPEGDFRGFIMMHHPGLRVEVTRLSALLRDLNEEITETPATISPSGVSGMIESISDWTQISPLDETSSRADIERIERETRETVNRRIQVLNDIARIMRNAAGQLEQVSGRRLPSASSAPVSSVDLSRLPTQFNTENQLSLFGERSIFNPRAQEQALNALEQEVIQQEREWRSKQGVAAVESLLGVTEGPTDEKGKGKAKQEVEPNDAQEGEASVTPEAQGKAPVKVTVEDVDDE
ncbi:uncharacterized protein LAJ45_00811 [Morchella importuna]|uniref:uncharacterized protein n=1 Tax=Morchella importuna TaxID=1174673 RepID=UPI001E8CF600|nr:uncharacterized protein LAJ45_00811 [Morchella importuna]KAH8155799.1 hypothetical protein LAJ45_00811 [Morchella importuna]